MTVQEHAGNDKSCVWHAADYADGELKDELFCIRFGSIESEYLVFFIDSIKLNHVSIVLRLITKYSYFYYYYLCNCS